MDRLCGVNQQPRSLVHLVHGNIAFFQHGKVARAGVGNRRQALALAEALLEHIVRSRALDEYRTGSKVMRQSKDLTTIFREAEGGIQDDRLSLGH